MCWYSSQGGGGVTIPRGAPCGDVALRMWAMRTAGWVGGGPGDLKGFFLVLTSL